MADSSFTFLWLAAGASLASPLGGWLGSRGKTGTLFLSISVGMAAGVLLGTFAFEMMPSAGSAAGKIPTIVGFVAGFLTVYAFDLYINHGFMAGNESDEWHKLSRRHRIHRARGSKVTLLAGSTAIEELIEGLSIGVGLAADPNLGIMVGAAIMLDNVVEGMSIAEIIRAEQGENASRPIFAWTGMIGLALFSSATVGWVFLSDVSTSVLGILLAIGAGGMFYLTVADLLPRSAKTQYQQSAALAVAVGFLLIFALTQR
ncbi:ZIP family metal transporter [Altererythrobacter sp. H2]|uniref:ZIP family metal transporter n=1 Tax=Altererythrobacter sp. H2 TaxID=3108391 RepID=UPI002B4BD498|nr:ZIP family metal transporter [Altererythrobacter sp. H2]WRK95231.1 ZIP family metal transporter [Altererythrobacter sp. H2]